METLQARGVEAGVVQDFKDLVEDPQLSHREHFVTLSHPDLGEMAFERRGYRLSETPGALHTAGPRLGQHTRAILENQLGLSPQAVSELIENGVAV